MLNTRGCRLIIFICATFQHEVGYIQIIHKTEEIKFYNLFHFLLLIILIWTTFQIGST